MNTDLRDDPRLTAYALGELNPTEAAQLQNQLAHDPAAAREVDEIRGLGDLLSQELEQEPGPDLTLAERDQILRPAASGGSAAIPERPRAVRWGVWEWLGVGVAGAAAAVAVGVWLNRVDPEPTRFAATAPQPEPAAPPVLATESVPVAVEPVAETPADAATAVAETAPIVPATETPEPIEVTPPAAVIVAEAPPAVPPAIAASAAGETAPLDLKLPIPAFMGTPTDLPANDHIERPSDKPRPPFLVPVGTRLLSLNAPVSSSDRNPINGALELVTDGNKEAGDSNTLELHRKLQWVQVDLGAPARLYAVVIWHAHDTPQIAHDVVVQVAGDPDFTQDVRTLYNNDYDNSAGLGVGTDKEYLENYEGRLIDARGVAGRYLRLYSQGSTYTALNRYTEVEVYGLPLAPAQAP